MNKLSSADLANVLLHAKAAVDQIPALMVENQELREKVASYERADRAEQLIHRMSERGLADHVEGRTTTEKVAALLDSGRDLDVLEEAINMSPNGGSPFEVAAGPARGGSGRTSDLELYLNGQMN